MAVEKSMPGTKTMTMAVQREPARGSAAEKTYMLALHSLPTDETTCNNHVSALEAPDAHDAAAFSSATDL